jgi:hypothetical protein
MWLISESVTVSVQASLVLLACDRIRKEGRKEGRKEARELGPPQPDRARIIRRARDGVLPRRSRPLCPSKRPPVHLHGPPGRSREQARGAVHWQRRRPISPDRLPSGGHGQGRTSDQRLNMTEDLQRAFAAHAPVRAPEWAFHPLVFFAIRVPGSAIRSAGRRTPPIASNIKVTTAMTAGIGFRRDNATARKFRRTVREPG